MSANHDHFTAKAYVINALILVFLMTATIVAYYIEMGMWNLPVAIGIGITKMMFILMVFMNVWKSSQLTKVFAGAGFFWFLILIGFTIADFLPATLPLGGPTTSALPGL